MALSKHHNILLHNKRLVARGGCRYSSPLAQDRAGPKAGGSSLTSKVYATPKDTFNNFSSNGSWTDNNNDDNMSLEFNNDALPFGTKSLAPCWSPPLSPPSSPVKPTTLYGIKDLPRPVCPAGRRPIILTGSGRDPTISPCSLLLFCVTFQEHIGQTPNCWNIQTR